MEMTGRRNEVETEITPEMIEEGELAFVEYEPLFESRVEAVCRIFRWMTAAKKPQADKSE